MPADPRPRGRLRQVAGSVQFRVTALAVLAVAAVLVATGVALVVAQRRLLTANVDYAIRLGADDLSARVAAGPVGATLNGIAGGTAQVVRADGSVLAASPDIRGQAPIGRPPPAGRT
jgi:hypothetical protein